MLKKLYEAIGWIIVVGVLLAGFYKVTHAGDAVSGLTVTTHRSLASVAVRAIVSGDDDTTAVCRIFAWWETTGQDDSGMVMVRRVATNMHYGRILWMTPGRTAHFYVEVDDDGVITRSPVDTVSVAQVRPNVATGPVFYVAPSGTDGGACTSASPCKTITGGLAKLAASADSGAFGGVIVRPGEYHERIDATFGRDGKPRFIAGDRTNRDSTIVCGANEHGEAGRYAEAGDLSWTQIGYASSYPPTVGVYKAYLPDGSGAESDAAYGDSVGSVVIGWGEYLHRKTSIAALFADSTGTESSANLAANGEVSGWFYAGDTLYVKRASRATPAGSVFHFGYRTQLIAVAGRNWSVRNLTVRYGGGKPLNVTASALEDPGTAGDGIINVRTTGVNSSGLVVDSCLVYGNLGLGVYAAYSSATIRADSVTIANSIFDGLTIGSMDYRDAKGRIEEDANVLKVTGSHSNVYRCTVRETHNGIQTGPSSADNDTTWGSGGEVYGNLIHTLSDDAMELDTSAGINMLVMNNTTDDTNTGVSVAPVYRGPLFYFYNTSTRFKFQGIKTGFEDYATVVFYHNTFATDEPSTSAYGIGSADPIEGRHIFANNILSASQAISGYEPSEVTFNYSLLDSTRGSSLIRWEGVNGLNWTTWQATGNDANSYYGDPKFSMPTSHRVGGTMRPDVRLLRSSPAYRAGRKIAGVNSGWGSPRYLVSPHIGSKSCVNCWREEAEK